MANGKGASPLDCGEMEIESSLLGKTRFKTIFYYYFFLIGKPKCCDGKGAMLFHFHWATCVSPG